MAPGDSSDTGLENYVWLPDVAVTLTLNNTGAFDNFCSLFWDFSADPIYYYQYSTEPNTYSGFSGTTLDADPYAPITFQFESGPGIDLPDPFRCFGRVSDAGAIYSATLCSYIPDVTNPKMLTSCFSPGHAFITLTKSNNGISVSQSFGFYPQNGLKVCRMWRDLAN